MPQKNDNINGYILAGGKSSRMGSDKGLIPFKGKPLIQYVIEQLEPAVNKVVLVANNSAYQDLGLEVIPDIIKDIGPAGGIYSALKHTDTCFNFILSCDMPFIKSEAIEFIIQNSFQWQITVPIYHQQIEPLCGIYTKDCLIEWEGFILQNIIRLHDMISYFKLLKLNVDTNKLFNDQLFLNINTPPDLINALNENTMK
ncbi:MAG: molybdenum cofactor guanylyltransferase [Pedobacter sp.]|jgi:molybdopterin-guanine dinucleotide biosynthesis protein A